MACAAAEDGRMIRGDVEVIGHRAPMPRIQIGQRDAIPADPNTASDLARSEMWQFQRWAEGDRIWRLVRQACEGNG